jgi:hypothetical protein
VRVTPYRREGASDRGLVVTILDVSALHRAESAPGEPKLSAGMTAATPPNRRAKRV